MTDAVQTARRDLAFLKAVTEDRGPLPANFGAHLLAAGLVFGADSVLTWAIRTDRVSWPPELGDFSWLLAWIVYAPIMAILIFMGARQPAPGPSGYVVYGAFGVVGAMSAATIAVIQIAARQTGDADVKALWLPLLFVIYGGAWSIIALVRRHAWLALVALGSFLTAAAAAALINTPEIRLVAAAGILLFLALPGAVIVRLAHRAAYRAA